MPESIRYLKTHLFCVKDFYRSVWKVTVNYFPDFLFPKLCNSETKKPPNS